MKKFISLMLLFAFASFTWAQAEDEEEDEEEEVVEVVKPKKAAKPAVKAGNSRIGLQAGIASSSDYVMVVYDMGTGLRLNLGLDFHQYSTIADNEKVTKNAIAVAAGVDYQLGQTLLPYGVGAMINASNEPMYDGAGKAIVLFPYFYAEAEIIKNLAATVKSGAIYVKPEEGDADITLGTSAALTLYFH